MPGLSVYFQSWQVSAACWPFFTLYPMRFHSAKVWNVSAASMAEKMFSALSALPSSTVIVTAARRAAICSAV